MNQRFRYTFKELRTIEERVFNISDEGSFQELAIEVFNYQARNIPTYHEFLTFLGINPSSVTDIYKIPFLPIEVFKYHKVLNPKFKSDFYFQSSGTTSSHNSKHYIFSQELYKESISRSFSKFFGDPSDYIFLALLPNYLDNPHSSLIYMMRHLMDISKHIENKFYHNDFEVLKRDIISLIGNKPNKKIILIGVAYALLDFATRYPTLLPKEQFIVLETGGMKGRKKEITREELHKELKNAFGLEEICSEYAMTELMSQTYSLADGYFSFPDWMKILIRSPYDPIDYYRENKVGAINIIDLANLHSCAFIQTQDIGKLTKENTFEVLGRLDNSDIRGCSLLYS